MQDTLDAQLADQYRKINERLYALERKLDVLAGLLKPTTTEARPAPRPQATVSSAPINPSKISLENNYRNHNNHQPKERPMYPITCPDCKKECLVPIKPTGNRPIYCKDCFSARRGRTELRIKTENSVIATPQSVPAAQVQAPKAHVKMQETPVKTKKKSVKAVKKSAPKKKPSAKKQVKRKNNE